MNCINQCYKSPEELRVVVHHTRLDHKFGVRKKIQILKMLYPQNFLYYLYLFFCLSTFCL
jgi:hypothetical protein